jgi:hypothetical protein
MPLSGSTNYALTRDDLISAALRKTNTIGTGETPDSSLVTEVAGALQRVVKALEADGMPLWRITEATLTPVAGTVSYTIGESATINTPAPLKVLQAFRRKTLNNVTNDVPMHIDPYYDYNLLPNKTTAGYPVRLFYKAPGANAAAAVQSTIYLWPVPDSTFVSGSDGTGTIKIYYQRPFDDLDASGDHLDFPSYWYQAVVWGLADEIAGEQGVPLGERSMIHKRAQEERLIALSFGTEEGSIRFFPDPVYLESLK